MPRVTEPSIPLPPGGEEPRSTRQHLLAAIAIAIGFFCYLAWDAGRTEFSSSSENVVVQAAMEIRQGGPVWVPNMHGMPRINKPPLAAWIAAAAMSEKTIADIRSTDPQVRDAAYNRLASEVRWPSALSTAIALVGVYVLGSLLLGPTVGIVSMLMAGTALLTYRFGRIATTDVQLTLWVTWANVCLVAALLLKRPWYIAISGVFLGLAAMSKGPVGLAQTLLPAAAFLGYLRYSAADRVRLKPLVLPTAAAILLMLAISLPWPVSIYLWRAGVVEHWAREITRVGATNLEPDPWYGYLNIIPNMMPWVAMFIGGLCAPFLSRLRNRGVVFAWLLLVVPVVVMSFFSDKADRYALPLIMPAAILSAFIAEALVKTRGRWHGTDKLVVVVQWAILLILPITVLAATLFAADRIGIERRLGIPIGVLSTIVALAAWFLRKRRPWALVGGTVLATLIVYFLIGVTYAADNGRSAAKPLAQQIYQKYPSFRPYYYDPREQPRHIPTDLGIYLGGPVIHIQHPGEVEPGGTPALVFMLKRKREPMPVFPNGTIEFDTEIAGQHMYVFRVPAAITP